MRLENDTRPPARASSPGAPSVSPGMSISPGITPSLGVPTSPSDPSGPGVTANLSMPSSCPGVPSSSEVPLDSPSMPLGSPDVPDSPGRTRSSSNVSPGPVVVSISLDVPASPEGPSDSPSEPVLQRYENITKSESDKRDYRALVLSNRMKVLLVSDRKADMSAAALELNVGSYSDPDELPGLAHFCEHMLFMGTEKYPEENGYGKFVSEHGGSYNAGTGTDYTNYYFNILPKYLAPCLDMFAQFFISPLFTESATERELNAVDSEHQNSVCWDGLRLHQQDACMAAPAHPYRKFATGNRHTLATAPKEKGIDVRRELLRFHQRWYSANIMALTVFGKETLDDLEAMVVPLFLPVKDSSVEAPAWRDHPFPPSLCCKRSYCDTIADIRQFKMTFPIPDMKEYYRSNPCGYLSHLVGHEGPGSLLSALKAREWCTSLWAGPYTPGRGFAFFEIGVELTEEGVRHTDDIAALTFQYLAMLRARRPERGVWEEQRALAQLAFRFEEPCDPAWLGPSLASTLQEFPMVPMEDILVSRLVTDWRPELIEEILALLIPKNVRIQIAAKCFANKCTQVEPWYGTKYMEEDIEADKIKDWQSVVPNPDLHMPPPNEFVPSRLELDNTDPPCESIAPDILKDTPFIRLWYKKDNEFLLPKASIEFELNSPLPAQSPRNYKLNAMLVMLVEEDLQEATYSAGLAGLSWSLRESLDSITISIDGFDDKQHLLLETIMDRVVGYKPDPRKFAIMKEKRIRDLKNKETDQPYMHGYYQQDLCLSERVQWTNQQLLDALESLTPIMLEDFVPRFMRSVYVEGFAFGNLSRARALKLADIIESRIPKDAVPLLAQELLKSRGLEIDKGGHYLRETENAVHTSSCAIVYLQVGVVNSRSNVLLELLQRILSEPCFDTLRTKEQLGYIVWCSVEREYGVQGLCITVQGDAHPAYLHERIDAFLRGAQEYLESISEEEFLQHRAAQAAVRLEKPKQIGAMAGHLWSEIGSQMYNFDRARVEVEVLNTVSKEELIQFYKTHISDSSPDRRKLSLHVVSTAKGGAGDKPRDNKTTTDDNDNDKQPTQITDLIEFKSRMRVYPRPVAFATVPKRGS